MKRYTSAAHMWGLAEAHHDEISFNTCTRFSQVLARGTRSVKYKLQTYTSVV